MRQVAARKPPLLFLLAALLFACSSGPQKSSGKEVSVHFLLADGKRTPNVSAELAITEGQRSLGLMYRKELAEDRGMLFVFPSETMRSFWMKNTYIELDMIFMNKRRKVVSIIHRAIPHTETSRRSTKPAKYVLEVPGGLAETWGLTAGVTMKVEGEIPPAS